MQDRHGILGAMERLVRYGDVQGGFRRLTELGLQDHTVEAGILELKAQIRAD